MIDAHCHLDRIPLENRAAVLKRAEEAGVEGVVIPGVDASAWRAPLLEAGSLGLWRTLGWHPWAVAHGTCPVAELRAELESALDTVDACGIGELGLDSSRHVPDGTLERQEEAFVAQLEVARRRDLPVVLHIVGCHGRALDILRREGLPARGGMIHAFSGAAEVAARYLDLGLYISVGGLVCGNARKLREAVPTIPRDRLLIETDAPDQTPAPLRPAENEPANLSLVAAEVAALRNEPPDDVAGYAARNTRTVFGL